MQQVKTLADDVPNVTWEPLGKLGDVSPSQAERELDREIYDSIRHYGTRAVRDKLGNAFFQALVFSLDHFHWINLHRIQNQYEDL